MEIPITKSLVADYESSSEDELSFRDVSNENHAVPLASASEMLDQNTDFISSSVFTNPYQKAEDYEQSVLEKHVKMTTINEPEKQNKKICYKFRKGKCRLGDKCSYLHHNQTNVTDVDSSTLSDDEDGVKKVNVKSKKRIGLKDDLVPPKKYMKVFNKNK